MAGSECDMTLSQNNIRYHYITIELPMQKWPDQSQKALPLGASSTYAPVKGAFT